MDIDLGSDPDDAQGSDPIADLESEGLAALASNSDRPYYDATTDGAHRDRYYAGVDLGAAPAQLYAVLHQLLESTHVRPRDYRPSVELYPWVDLYPDGHLRNIYSGLRLDPEEAIRSDARIARERATRVTSALRARPAMSARELLGVGQAVADVLHFNCEHVVPQSWFDEHEPMRGDLHHLFTCQPQCNSMRGSMPFAELDDSERPHAECGWVIGDGDAARFEPLTGKGAAARATLYFLLRYPGRIGDSSREHATSVATLLAWHADDPAGEYERHRNAAIAEVQGNRNPLIDFPEQAVRADFDSGLGSSAILDDGLILDTGHLLEG